MRFVTSIVKRKPDRAEYDRILELEKADIARIQGILE